jgi:hypothetical protein
MARRRFWTCRKCKTKHRGTTQLCVCGTRRPKKKTAKHTAGLEDYPYEWYVERFGEQCGICGNGPKTRHLNRHHSHWTGKPLGLLCHACNRKLWKDVTKGWLLAAAHYVDR